MPGRDDLVLARKGSRAGAASLLSPVECAAVAKTIVFANTVDSATMVELFLKRAGAVHCPTWDA